MGPLLDKIFNIVIFVFYTVTTTKFLWFGEISLLDKILIVLALGYILLKIMGNIFEVHE